MRIRRFIQFASISRVFPTNVSTIAEKMSIPRKRLYDVVHICKHLQIIVEDNGQFLFQGPSKMINLVGFLESFYPSLQLTKT